MFSASLQLSQFHKLTKHQWTKAVRQTDKQTSELQYIWQTLAEVIIFNNNINILVEKIDALQPRTVYTL